MYSEYFCLILLLLELEMFGKENYSNYRQNFGFVIEYADGFAARLGAVY